MTPYPSLAAMSALGLGLGALACFKVLLFDDRPLPRAHRVSATAFHAQPKRFLVTGAASGVGRHLTTSLLKRGHRVLACDLNIGALAQMAAESSDWARHVAAGNLVVLQLDVSKGEDWERAVRQAQTLFDGLDVCMNVAGFLRPAKTQHVADKDVHLHTDVNFKGVVFGTVHASRLMAGQVAAGKLPQGAHIVNFASLGALAPVSGVSLYIGSKYGVRGFSLCASKDLWGTGVYVSCVMPDAIQTPMVDLQLHHAESAMAFSGSILTLEQVEAVVMKVLVARPREVKIATSLVRGLLARVDDMFSGSLLIGWAEEFMRKRGEAKQRRILSE
jgi:NAD(P)-dependent dehydrogenase (short-subunit alcohol dehydrogenase family)